MPSPAPEREDKPVDPSPAPPPSVDAGTRVVIDGDIGDYDGANYGASGSGSGVILGYATPELKDNQVWPKESYFVRFDFDPPDSRRVVDRSRLIVVEDPDAS